MEAAARVMSEMQSAHGEARDETRTNGRHRRVTERVAGSYFPEDAPIS